MTCKFTVVIRNLLESHEESLNRTKRKKNKIYMFYSKNERVFYSALCLWFMDTVGVWSLLTTPSQDGDQSNKRVQLQTQLNIQRRIHRPAEPIDFPVETLRCTLNVSQDFSGSFSHCMHFTLCLPQANITKQFLWVKNLLNKFFNVFCFNWIYVFDKNSLLLLIFPYMYLMEELNLCRIWWCLPTGSLC